MIRSFQQDKPFDQFIREQLAGDELTLSPPGDAAAADALLATGYLRLGPWDSTAAIFQEEDRLRNELQADLVNTTAAAFLGLTLGCCQCHDHKYDPLSQADHYRLRAFFAPLQPRDDLVIATSPEVAEIEQHNARLAAEIEPLQNAATRLLEEARQRVEAERRGALESEVREALQTDPAGWDEPTKARLEPILAQLVVSDDDARAAFPEATQAQFTEWTSQIAALNAGRREPAVAMGATDSGETAPATRIFHQGNHAAPGDEVAPGFLSVLWPEPAVVKPPRESTTGRRLALAHWIASSDNPWTARVIVNRIWQQHFGVGLVATPNDWGFSGSPTTHPELLDWLAVEFVARGWSIKELRRLILQSATWQQESREPGPEEGTPTQQIDPQNRLLWRQNVRRLDAETLRDALLAVSGLLRSDTGGAPRWPEVPEELRHAQPGILEADQGGDDGRRQGWYTDPVEQTDVRSIFLVRKRCLPIPFLQAFDQPDSSVSCARRDTTVVAPQALFLLNSPEMLRIAEATAQRVRDHAGDAPELEIEAAFRLVLTRLPDEDERQLARELLQQHAAIHAGNERAPQTALTDLCRALLNLNEFTFVD